MHQTPFYTNYGYYPKFDLLSLSKNDNPAANDFATQLSQLQAKIKLHLQETQDRYKHMQTSLEKNYLHLE